VTKIVRKLRQKSAVFAIFKETPTPHWKQTSGASKLNEKRSNRAVNDICAYSQCKIKKKLSTYWTYNNKSLPTLKNYKACLNRTPINYEDEAQKNIWKFWVDQILDVACANKFYWNPAVRYFNKNFDGFGWRRRKPVQYAHEPKKYGGVGNGVY